MKHFNGTAILFFIVPFTAIGQQGSLQSRRYAKQKISQVEHHLNGCVMETAAPDCT